MGLTYTPAQPLVAVYDCGCRSNTEPYYQYCPIHAQPVRYSYVSHGLGDISGLTHYCLDPHWINVDDGAKTWEGIESYGDATSKKGQ